MQLYQKRIRVPHEEIREIKENTFQRVHFKDLWKLEPWPSMPEGNLLMQRGEAKHVDLAQYLFY